MVLASIIISNYTRICQLLLWRVPLLYRISINNISRSILRLCSFVELGCQGMKRKLKFLRTTDVVTYSRLMLFLGFIEQMSFFLFVYYCHNPFGCYVLISLRKI